MNDEEFLKVAFTPWELRTGMSSDLLFAHVFPKTATPPAHGSPGGECESPSPSDSEDSDGEALAYRDQFGKRIKLGSKMPPWAEEAVEERQRPPEASGQQQRVRIFETTDASTLD